jgi:superfamily II DNA or RNA helicase
MDDLFYRPPEEGVVWLKGYSPEACLLLGPPSETRLVELRTLECEIRIAAAAVWERVLHRGTYLFRVGGRWSAIVVDAGLEPVTPESGRERYTEGHLGTASYVFDHVWGSAHVHAGASRFQVGDVVSPVGAKNRLGRVRKVVVREEGYEVHVDIDGQTSQFSEDALVRIEGDPRDPEFWISAEPADVEQLAFTLTWTKLKHPLTDTLYSFASSKTVFRPYQFVPVLKLLSSPTGRLLIADEVGLGKTIEAGLIWSELEQRANLNQVLVVAPASLTLKWKAEMERRFDRRLNVLRASDLADFAARLRDGQDPPLSGVISLEALRSATSVLETLNELRPKLDLVIVDEAHAMRNRGTKNHDLGLLLSDWADYLIFLSATPLNLGQDDLFNLVNLLSEEEFTDRAVFNSQLEPNQVLNDIARELVGDGRKRPKKLRDRLDDIDAMTLGSMVVSRPDFQALRDLLDCDAPLSSAEVAKAKRFIAELNTLSGVFTRTRKVDVPDAKAVRQPEQVNVNWTTEEAEFYRSVYRLYMQRSLQAGTPPGFGMQMPLRQAASCIPAMQELLRSKDPGIFLREVDDFDDGVEDDVGEQHLWDVMPQARPVSVDSKFDALLDRLLQARNQGLRQVMIFSFFRRTLSYLAGRLESDFSLRVMTGSTKMDERQRIMDDFRAGEFEMLLLSQVGAEGLDFEFCNVLVNYDLPWNPMQVEQRIGRLDRFGQEHEKIFVFNMHVPGTIESDIFERLYSRIGVFTRSIGELEPILRDDFSALNKRLLDPRLTEQQRREQADRMAVAMESRSQEIQRLGESGGLLSSIDQLRIDGMTDEGPSDGRFVGAAEVRRILQHLFDRLGGRVSSPDTEGICDLIGSDQLAYRLRTAGLPSRGSMFPPAKLSSMLLDGERVRVTFDADVASKHNVELLSSRHPLIALAMEEFGQDALSLRRFGGVGIPGLTSENRYLARVDLAASTGIRPLLELWVTAVDMETGERNDEIGPHLLRGLAEGTLRPWNASVTPGLRSRLDEVDTLAGTRRIAVERERRRDNEALVEARIQSRLRSNYLKIQRVEATLAELRTSDPAIVRLHRGRLRNLKLAGESIRPELEEKKMLNLSLTPVAVLVLGPG